MKNEEWLARTCWIGLGGFLGANARYWLGGWVQQRLGPNFPWGTFVINLSGSFLLGLLLAILAERLRAPAARTLQLLIGVGFLGAYTTFSTFTYETLVQARATTMIAAALNVVGSVAGGLLCAWLGLRLGRLF